VNVETSGPRWARLCLWVAVVMTYLGTGVMLATGAMFVFGVHDDRFLGSEPTATVGIAGAPVPLESAPAVGVILLVVGVALIMLAALARQGRALGRLGLTGIGAVALVGLIYIALSDDPRSPLAPIAWIVVALALLWAGARHGAPPSGKA
jgi:hypothetical protein